jgi:simple sugar transport system substrate-binding protein
MKSIRLVTFVLALVLIVSTIAACAPAAAPAAAPAKEAAPAAQAQAAPAAEKMDKKVTLIIYAGPAVEFFVPVVNGAKDAAAQFGIDLNVVYGEGDPVKQNNLIETAIANKVDGLAVSIQDDKAFDESVRKAREAGIPVVSFNVDDSEGAKGNDRMAFMGQDFVDTGYLIASRMIGDHGIKSGDKLLCPVEAPEAVYAVQRYAGVKKAMDEIGATCELLGVGFNLAEAQTKEAQYLVGHPDTKAIIGLGSVPLTVAPKATEEAKMKLPLGGFDLTPEIIKGIEDGTITATVDQQPYSQGYYSVAQLALFLKYGLYPSDMKTGGLGLVDKTNVDKVKALVGKIR